MFLSFKFETVLTLCTNLKLLSFMFVHKVSTVSKSAAFQLAVRCTFEHKIKAACAATGILATRILVLANLRSTDLPSPISFHRPPLVTFKHSAFM